MRVGAEADGFGERLKVLEVVHPKQVKDAQDPGERLRVGARFHAPLGKEMLQILRRGVRGECRIACRDAGFFEDLFQVRSSRLAFKSLRDRKQGLKMPVCGFKNNVRELAFFSGAEDLLPPLIHRAALFVQHVVVFQKVLPQVEVRAFYFCLRLRHGARYEFHLDRLVIRDVEPLHDTLDALAAENAQEVVV